MSGAKKVHECRVEAMVRVRPFNRRELEKLRAENDGMAQSIVMMKGRRVSLMDPHKGYQECEAFDFDECFWSIPDEQMSMSGTMDMKDDFIKKALADMGMKCVGQQEVFEKTGACAVQHAFDGFHSCIFAYGQTGAGKTFSMLGGLDASGGLEKGQEHNRGICPRLVEALFEKIAFYREKGDNTIYSIELSFLEIYKEKCKDLLLNAQKKKSKSAVDAEKDYADLKVRQNPSMGMFVDGLSRVEIKTVEQCMKLMASGMESRHTAPTKMNDVSSRSHGIFQITFKQKNPVSGTTTLSNINLVDLAGSERVKMSGVVGERLDEATKINQSLSTLRRVIDVLIEAAKKKSKLIPPYRESMLTWLLSESLGGNSKTIMLAAVSPYHGNFEDTANTLRYANKAKDIVCKAKRNDERGAVVVQAMRAEMEKLRQQLESKAAANDEETRAQLKNQLDTAESEYQRAKEEFDTLQEQGRELREKHEALVSEIKARDEIAQNLRQIKEETSELKEKRAELEKEAVAVGQQADELSKKLKSTEAEIEETRKEKEALREEEIILRQKEETTRLEMLHTKQRQLALAFRNSLQIYKDKKFIASLTAQQTTAKEKFAKIEAQLEMKKVDLAKVQDENRYLTTTYEQAQQRLADLNRNYEDSMALLTEKIQRLVSAKKKAELDRESYLEDIRKTEEQLEKLKEEKEKENSESASKLEALEAEYHAVVRENDEADSEIANAQVEVARSKSQLAALREEHKRLAEQNGVTGKDLADVEAEHKELLAVNKQLLAKVTEAREQLASTDRERTDMQTQIEEMSQEIKRITRNHDDLKQFVSSRFFPTGQVPNATAEPTTRRPMSPQRAFIPPRATLKTRQQQQIVQQKRERSVGPASPARTATSSRHTDPTRGTASLSNNGRRSARGTKPAY